MARDQLGVSSYALFMSQRRAVFIAQKPCADFITSKRNGSKQKMYKTPQAKKYLTYKN